MDLTEEDIQIWYFGPDDVGTKFKLSTWTYFIFSTLSGTRIKIEDIEYLGESHRISCMCTNYTSPNYLYSAYGHIPPTSLFQDVDETR